MRCKHCDVIKSSYTDDKKAPYVGKDVETIPTFWYGHYCYDCVLLRKKLREQATYGKKPLVDLNCRNCGERFHQNQSNQRHCTLACRRSFAWKQVNQAKKTIRRAAKPIKNCLVCGVVLTRGIKFCNQRCQYRFYNPPKPKIIAPPPHLRPCETCDRKTKNKRFCSRSCQSIYCGLFPKIKPEVIKAIKPIQLKVCVYCQVKFETMDHKRLYCSKSCHRRKHRFKRKHRDKLRELKKLQRVPKWADKSKLLRFYSECPEGYHVDHIVPLNGKQVCGFHVEYNLQYLPASENVMKSNLFDGTYDNSSWSVLVDV